MMRWPMNFATRQWIDLFRDWERDIERLASSSGIFSLKVRQTMTRVPIVERPVRQSRVDKRSPLRRLALLSIPVIALVIGGAYLYWPLAVSSPQVTADDRAWSEAANLGTFEALKQYLDGYRNGKHVADAQQRLHAIDDKAWADAFGTGTIVALGRYAAQFPDGAHFAQARRSIAGLERQAADQNHSSRTLFDGTWEAAISCSNAAGAQGYTRQFTSQVKDGIFHGQSGDEGQPNWLTVDGTIQVDGSAELSVRGIISDSAFAVGNTPSGSKYSYHVLADLRAPAKGNRGAASVQFYRTQELKLRSSLHSAGKRVREHPRAAEYGCRRTDP